jgi:hypothetical protein
MKPAHSHLPECVAGTASAVAQARVASAPELARRAALGDFDAEVMAWLAESFRRHVIDGQRVETALRLDRASRMRVRNDALRCAAALLKMGDEGVWTIAGKLLQAVVRHNRLQQPETPLEGAVSDAFAAGVDIPESQQGLYDIIAK